MTLRGNNVSERTEIMCVEDVLLTHVF